MFCCLIIFFSFLPFILRPYFTAFYLPLQSAIASHNRHLSQEPTVGLATDRHDELGHLPGSLGFGMHRLHLSVGRDPRHSEQWGHWHRTLFGDIRDVINHIFPNGLLGANSDRNLGVHVCGVFSSNLLPTPQSFKLSRSIFVLNTR